MLMMQPCLYHGPGLWAQWESVPKSPMLLSRDQTAHSLQHELEINTVQGPKNWGGGSMRCHKTWPQRLSPRRLCSWQLWDAPLVPFRSCASGVLVAWSLPKPGKNSKASMVLGSHFFEGLLSLPSLPLSLERDGCLDRYRP